uniref:Uncharacterized protein n=1 Tax=Schizaphis graminum TaxID=13262 RepID=A0A2S2P7G7_SCHGA
MKPGINAVILTHSAMVPRADSPAFIASGTVKFVFCDEQLFLNKFWWIALPFSIASENNLVRLSLADEVNKQLTRMFDVFMFVAISSAIIVHALLPSMDR